MENRELLIEVIVAAVVVIAVLAAGYVLVTTLFSGPGPTPTAGPTLHPTLSPNSTIPSGPFNPTRTPSGSAAPANPTPAQPVSKKAELVGWGTDKDTYNRGENATMYIVIKNTGNVPVNDARLDIVVKKYVPIAGPVPVQSPTAPLTDLDIQPGETKNIQYTYPIPSEYQGISTVGKYQFVVNVNVWDTSIGSFQKDIEIK